MSVKEIIFPHFLHCCQETDDLFWKYIFEDFSYGRAPYGVYFTKGFMCCGFRGKEFSYKVDPNKPTPELFKEVKSILQIKLGIQSREDRQAQREKFNQASAQLSLSDCNDWNDVKRKEVRSILIENFVLKKMRDKNRSQIKRALAMLMLSLQLKILSGDNISIQNGQIVEIEGWQDIQDNGINNWKFDKKKKNESCSKKSIMSLWKN